MTKTYTLFNPRSDKRLTCIAADNAADQAAIDAVVQQHPYGYTKRLNSGLLGIFCPDSRDDLEAALGRHGFSRRS